MWFGGTGREPVGNDLRRRLLADRSASTVDFFVNSLREDKRIELRALGAERSLYCSIARRRGDDAIERGLRPIVAPQDPCPNALFLNEIEQKTFRPQTTGTPIAPTENLTEIVPG